MLALGMLLYGSSMLAECGPAVNPDTIRAIIQVESGGNPLAIGDNTARKSYFPKTVLEAVQLATRLLRDGHSIDIGLMQINSCHISPRNLSLQDLFDPCNNIRIGTTILSEFYRQHRTEDPAQSLFRALSSYNTGRVWKGTGYINRILEAAGASYRVSTPFTEFPMQEGEKRETKVRTERGSAASSPLFFDNTSSSMKAGGL